MSWIPNICKNGLRTNQACRKAKQGHEAIECNWLTHEKYQEMAHQPQLQTLATTCLHFNCILLYLPGIFPCCQERISDQNHGGKRKLGDEEPRIVNKCDHCNKSFKKPSDLVRHIRIHTGEKPFACHICTRSFTVKSTLDSHMKTHEAGKFTWSAYL